MAITFGADPIGTEIEAILSALAAGESVDASVERQFVDLKEEDGRRDREGNIGPSVPHNDAAARALAADAACMANTPGGGALIVGVTNAGFLVGTDLDAEWLRHRMWELSGKALTSDVLAREVVGTRVLIIRTPQAFEPIRINGKIRWRVGANCVEVDPHTWHERRMDTLNYDWSAQESTLPVSEARPAAIALARDFLRESGESHAEELASDSDTNLLRRLNVATPDGRLTNAGALAFVGRADPCLDYIRRTHAGGDSLSRIHKSGRSLLEELAEVFQAVDANTPTVHLPRGLVIAQHREIPRRAAREAIVNGVAHREWGVADPTVVEHVGRLIRVTSPGGFVGGVTADNIITHPSRSRNRALAELLAALRIAEREGIGVDRMITDMVGVGHPRPEFEEISGPYVRTSLIGDDLDVAWIAWLRRIEPGSEPEDLNSLLILRRLVEEGWVDALRVAVLVQDSVGAAQGALTKLSQARVNGHPVIETVDGTPDGAEPVWRLHPDATKRLASLDQDVGRQRRWPSRVAVADSFARARGRISSTELAGITGGRPQNMGPTLKGLEDDEVLAPAWPSRRGKGFYYRYVGDKS